MSTTPGRPEPKKSERRARPGRTAFREKDMVVSANRLELLQIADAVAREKSIDKSIVIVAMADAIQKAARQRYGQETNIRADINATTGEMKLQRLMEVKENVEDFSREISLRDARERYDVPVVEVVLPAVRRATAATRSGRIGVIGTQATITSGAYEDAFAAVPGIGVTSAACPSFVDFVERGVTSGRQLLGLAQSYLDPLLAAGVDTVVLGCTHYPLLQALIEREAAAIAGRPVRIVDSAHATAEAVADFLREREAAAEGPEAGRLDLMVTDLPKSFADVARRFLGANVPQVTQIDL